MKCAASYTLTVISDGAQGKPGVGVSSIVREFALSSSSTSAPSSGWSTTRPSRNAGQTIWVRDKTTYSDGKVVYSTPYPATGDKGDTGATGPKGDKGETGAQGPQGPQGNKGDKGDKGETGEKGPQGDEGNTGAQGNGYYRALIALTTSSKSVAKDKVSPASKALLYGDTIVDTNGLVFAVTAATSSSASTVPIEYRYSIKGPQGNKGDKGDKGETGATGPQGPKGDKGETGATGPQGDKGDDGTDGDALSLSVVSASDRFTLTWMGTAFPESQVIELEAFSKHMAAESISWTCSDGTLSVISSNLFRRKLDISSISDETLSSVTSIKIQVSGLTEQGTSLLSTLFISIIKAENPVPIYCGMVDLSSDSTTNPARKEGIYAPGDYVFYSGSSNDDYVYGNIYEWDGESWAISNTGSHTFGALEDLVQAASKDSSTTPFQIIKNLIASNIVGDSLSIRNANIAEKLTVDNISGKDENGIGFELTKDGISATRRDENGKIVSSWEFRSDGSGSILNLDVLGNLIASAINHEALITQSATAFGDNGQTSYQKTFPKDLWSRSKMHQKIVSESTYSDSIMRTMTAVSGASYGGKALAKIGIARASLLPDNVISNTEAETVGSLQFGIYKRSYSVTAGSRHEKLAMKTNNFGFPVYVDATWSLTGNWNWQEMYIYGTDGKEVYSNNAEDNGSYHNCFILPPGYTIRIAAGSTAWFGNKTASFTVKVAPCPMVPYISEGALSDVTQTASSSVAGMQYWNIGTASVPSCARYIAFFYNKNGAPCDCFRISNGSDNAVLTLSKASKLYSNGPVYMEIPESLRGKTITIAAGASRIVHTSDEDGTSYSSYKCYMKLVRYALFSYIPDKRDAILLEYADGTTEKIDASYETSDYRDWDINRLIFSSYDSSGYLEKISGTTVCSWLDAQGFTKGAQFSMNEESSLSIDDVSYGTSHDSRLISIQKISNGYQLICDGTTVIIYLMNGAVSSSFGFYDVLSLLFYPLASESKILTRNIEPQENETYDIGSEEKKIRNTYCKEGFFNVVWGAVAN